MQNKRSIVLLGLITFCTLFVTPGTAQPNKQAELSNNALKKAIELSEFNSAQIRDLLSLHKFKEIEIAYEDILNKYQKNVHGEYLLHKAYEFFDSSNGVTVSELDLWVAQTSSYIAYAARGAYKAQQGLSVRGGKFIGETPSWKIEEMQHFFEEAAKDLNTAVSKRPQLIPAYTWLVVIAKTSTMPFTPLQVMQKALAIDKRAYYVRYQYMVSLQPKWGGSYEKMSAFAQQAIEYNNMNPRLWSLQGEVDADKGFSYWRKNEFADAIQAFTAALKFGDKIAWLRKRAASYYHQGQKEKSMEDHKRVLYYDPADKETLESLTYFQYKRQ